MPNNITIQFSVKSVLLILLTAAAIWLLVVFDKLLLILFIAMLLAIAIDPVVDRLERRKVPRAGAIVLVYLLLVAVVLAVIGLLIPVLLDEFSQLSATLPRATKEIPQAFNSLIAERFPSLAQRLSTSDLGSQLSGEIGTVAGSIGEVLVGVGQALTTLTVSTFLVLVVGFFLAADARFAPRFIARFFPPAIRPTASVLARDIGGRLGHWVRAQALVGLFFGVTFGIGLALVGIPYSLSLGVVGGVLELIPYVGGAIVTALGMLVALTVSPWLALGVLMLYMVVASVESHVVYPKLVGDIVGLHPLVIVIALFIGAEAKGVVGALLAVPVTVVIQVLFDHFYRFEDTGTKPAAEASESHVIAAQRPAKS